MKKFPVSYGTRGFVPVFTTHHWWIPFVTFHDKLFFYGEDLLAPRPSYKLHDYLLSAVCV